MSNKAKQYRDFVRSLQGRDKNGGKTLTIQEKKMLFIIKIDCPCLSCSTLDRKTFWCPERKCQVNPYNPRSCKSYNETVYKVNKEPSEEEKESSETQEKSQETSETSSPSAE